MASRKKAADQAVVDVPVKKTDDALFSTPADAVPKDSKSSSHLKLPTFWPNADELANLTREIHEPDALVEIYRYTAVLRMSETWKVETWREKEQEDTRSSCSSYLLLESSDDTEIVMLGEDCVPRVPSVPGVPSKVDRLFL